MQRIPVSIGNNTLHLRRSVSSNKPAVLLVHGLGVSGDYYLKYAEKLAPFYTIYLIDLPGYGKTPKPSMALTIPELAQVIIDFVVQEDLLKPVIIGQSMGTQIIAHALADVPHLFKKAIFLAPTVNKEERNKVKQSFRLLQDSFRESLHINAVVVLNYLRMGLGRFFKTFQFMIEDRIEDTLKNVNQPVLIVSGSRDKIVPPEWSRYLASVAKQGTFVEIEDAPHLLHHEKPDKLVTITRKFIDT